MMRHGGQQDKPVRVIVLNSALGRVIGNVHIENFSVCGNVA